MMINESVTFPSLLPTNIMQRTLALTHAILEYLGLLELFYSLISRLRLW